MASSKYKLVYFNFRARAEPIRFIFAVAGIPYEDYRIERDRWPGSIKETTPWGKLPFLEVDGERLAESSAICRFLARKFNLLGSNEFEAARCDELVDTMMDYRPQWRAYFFESDPIKKEALKNTFLEVNATYMPKFEAILEKSEGDFLLGKVFTWADLHIAHTLAFYEDTVDKTILEPYPNCEKLKEAVFNIPQIKKWVEERPPSKM